MADRPILFSGPMVRALLAGTKTQTRRVVPKQPTLRPDGLWDHHGYEYGIVAADDTSLGQWLADFQRIEKGDRLYVRETWTHTGTGVWTISDTHRALGGAVAYQADGPIPGAKYWPSIHMPRRFSRLTLTVTDVRVERLQDISEEDARAEGASPAPNGWWFDSAPTLAGSDARGAYYCLWNRINGPGSWEANPWVAAYTFTVERRNIDQLARAA